MITCKKCHKAIKSETAEEFCNCCYPEPVKPISGSTEDPACKTDKTEGKENNNPYLTAGRKTPQ